MQIIHSGRVAGSLMPLVFGIAIIFCLVRVGQTASNEYFVKAPDVKWQTSAPAVIWYTPDIEGTWKVRYRSRGSSIWHQSPAKLLKLVPADLFTQRRMYSASLSDLSPGQMCEYSVYRGADKVFSGHSH